MSGCRAGGGCRIVGSVVCWRRGCLSLLVVLFFPRSGVGVGSAVLIGGCPVVRGPRCGQSARHPPTGSCSSAWGRVPCRLCQRGVGVYGVRSVHPAIHEQPLMGVVRVLLRCLCCQCDVAGIEGSGVHLAGTPLHRPPSPSLVSFEFVIIPLFTLRAGAHSSGAGVGIAVGHGACFSG